MVLVMLQEFALVLDAQQEQHCLEAVVSRSGPAEKNYYQGTLAFQARHKSPWSLDRKKILGGYLPLKSPRHRNRHRLIEERKGVFARTLCKSLAHFPLRGQLLSFERSVCREA